jgi:hypothetical protein
MTRRLVGPLRHWPEWIRRKHGRFFMSYTLPARRSIRLRGGICDTLPAEVTATRRLRSLDARVDDPVEWAGDALAADQERRFALGSVFLAGALAWLKGSGSRGQVSSARARVGKTENKRWAVLTPSRTTPGRAQTARLFPVDSGSPVRYLLCVPLGPGGMECEHAGMSGCAVWLQPGQVVGRRAGGVNVLPPGRSTIKLAP